MTTPFGLPDRYSTIDGLLRRLAKTAKNTFAFERELTLYLLLVAALFPDQPESRLAAARIFSGSLNFHATQTDPKAHFKYQDRQLKFRDVFTNDRIDDFNMRFFRTIGGWQSLLFTPSASAFYDSVSHRVNELKIFHDTISFMLKASIASPRLSSSKLAYHAISRNFFRRDNFYNIKTGKKRERTNSLVTTPQSVREKWKRAPNTAFHSFLLTEIFAIHEFPPTDAKFHAYLYFKASEEPWALITHSLSFMSAYLKASVPKQNASIMKWADDIPDKTGRGLFGGGMRFSDEQLRRAMDLHDQVIRPPLSLGERDQIQAANERFDIVDFAKIATKQAIRSNRRG